MKTYVIILSKSFPVTHPRKGQETGFAAAFRSGRKIHTIRGNYPLWEKRLKEVQRGEAVLSLRQWTDRPYNSPQKEIARLTASDGVSVQRGTLVRSEREGNDGAKHFTYWGIIDKAKRHYNIDDMAKNDGFSSFTDFTAWFDPSFDKQEPNENGWRILGLAIIHFTKFRY